MPEETCLVTPGELQPLLHSTSDTALRRRVTNMESVNIDMDGECDTDSNKTEVEEIEMVDMEGRAEVKPFSKIQTDNLFFQKFMISQYS